MSAEPSQLQRLARMLDPAELQDRATHYQALGHGWKAFGLMQLAIFVHTAKGLRNEEITRRAAALTYHTLLSIVPVMAVGFALFKAFGGLQKLEQPLKQLMIQNLSVGRSQEVARWLEQFIGNINAGAIAGVGLLFLFYSAVGLLGNVESAFNRIWGVDRSRPLLMRFAIYWCVLTLAPPLVGLSLSLSARLQSSTFATTVAEWLPFGLGRLLVSGGSVISVCLVLIFLYQLVPFTKVRFRSALLGGLVAGLLWTASKVLFLWATAGSVKYSAIYGALGVLPLLMIWIYLSWIIVLFGVTFTYANQSLVSGTLERNDQLAGQTTRDALALRVMLAAARSFRGDHPAPTLEELSEQSGITPARLRPAVDSLVSLGLLAEVEPDARLTPAKALGGVSVASFLEQLRDHPQKLASLITSPTDHAWELIRETLERHRLTESEKPPTDVTLDDLSRQYEQLLAQKEADDCEMAQEKAPDKDRTEQASQTS